MRIETIKLWEDRDDVELTTFLTMADPFIHNPEKKPALIVCPGGGYFTCSRHGTEGDTIAMTFAAEGYQCFVLEYSVVSRAPLGKTLFPAQLIDFGKAFLTINEHAEEWLVDVNRISIIGFSAGANLCGMMATNWHKPLLKDYFGVESEVFKPLAALLIYGLLDYTIQEEFRKTKGIPLLPNDLNVPVFGEEDPSLERQKEYSPVCHVSEYTPPVFLAAAQNDGMVSAIQSIKMAEALHIHQIPYELHIFEYGDHGFGLGTNILQPYREDKAHACTYWVDMAKTFLLHKVAPETTEKEASPFADF